MYAIACGCGASCLSAGPDAREWATGYAAMPLAEKMRRPELAAATDLLGAGWGGARAFASGDPSPSNSPGGDPAPFQDLAGGCTEQASAAPGRAAKPRGMTRWLGARPKKAGGSSSSPQPSQAAGPDRQCNPLVAACRPPRARPSRLWACRRQTPSTSGLACPELAQAAPWPSQWPAERALAILIPINVFSRALDF